MKPMSHALFASLLTAAMIAAPSNAQRETRDRVRTEQGLSFDSRSGASLSGLLELIRDKTNANIVASEEADDILLPALSLRGASLGAALEAISQIVPSTYSVKIRANHDAGGKAVYAVQVMSRQRKERRVAGPAVPQQEVRVFSLRELIIPPVGADKGEGLTLSDEAVLNAIDVGLNMHKADVKAVMKFHVDSGLLFVRGTAHQLHVCDAVLSNLRNDLMRRRGEFLRHQAMQRVPKRTSGGNASSSRSRKGSR